MHNVNQKQLNCFSLQQQIITEGNELKKGIYKGVQPIKTIINIQKTMNKNGLYFKNLLFSEEAGIIHIINV